MAVGTGKMPGPMSSGRLFRRVESLVPRRAREYGGKAQNLAALARAGFPVPAAYALSGEVSRDALARILGDDESLASLVQRGETDERRLAAIAEKVRRAPLGTALEKDLDRVRDDLGHAGVRSLAVRSSSTREDDVVTSAAGLHETYLDVRTKDALRDAVRSCWASLFERRVVAYLRGVRRGGDAAMGVVVQAMVPADVSGVLFTVNPLTGDGGEMVVNAAWGLGPSIVDGKVSPDTYRIDKATLALRDRSVGDKSTRIVIGPDGGLREETLGEPARSAATISDGLLTELAALGRRVETQFGAPQDVEFAIASGTIYLLQSRPISTLSPGFHPRRSRGKPADRSRIVWSNVNVGEALPGVATPFTWSVLSGFSELGFRRAFGALGCRVPRDAELVGNFRGRIYLNLTEFVAISTQVPGLRPRTLLSLGGGGEVARLEAEAEDRGSLGFFVRLPVTITRFARENFRLTARVEEFEAYFEEERERYRAVDLRILSPIALGKTLRDIEDLLDRSGAIMLSSYGNLLASVVTLRSVLGLVAKRNADRIERALLTGLADVESAAPGLALWHIAEMARGEPGAREAILGSDPARLRIGDLPAGPTRRALERFIEAYGFRGAREAEIATPRWREDPTLLLVTIRAHLLREGDAETPVQVERRQRAVRESAARELERLLPAPVRAAVRHLLALVQRYMRVRERLRAHVTEVLGMFRDVVLDASRRMASREPHVGPDAAFFLTIEELHALLKGDARTVASLVRQRRQQHERDRRLPDPPDTFVGYPPESEPAPPATNALEGLPASSGRVQGVARVLTSPSDAAELRAGEILVAPYADVGWTPLFTLVAAVVTDLGGPLSHAAIVAREYGVPAVVNVKAGTRVIRTGDRLAVDGDAGTVEILGEDVGD